MRLDKLIEQQLGTTRKAMKRLFLMKKVKVDGEIELVQQRNVDSRIHQIEVDGKYLETAHVYYLLNKPVGVVTATKDLRCQTVIDLVDVKDQREFLYPVGRLDRDTTGLLLLTDNGQLGYDLLQPKEKVEKSYYAVINERVTEEDQQAFENGIVFIGGERCAPAKLTILSATQERSEVLLSIREGKFHQVKKMFLARGKKVIQLERRTMGGLRLPEDLPIGNYRSLTIEELQKMKKYFR